MSFRSPQAYSYTFFFMCSTLETIFANRFVLGTSDAAILYAQLFAKTRLLTSPFACFAFCFLAKGFALGTSDTAILYALFLGNHFFLCFLAFFFGTGFAEGAFCCSRCSIVHRAFSCGNFRQECPGLRSFVAAFMKLACCCDR